MSSPIPQVLGLVLLSSTLGCVKAGAPIHSDVPSGRLVVSVVHEDWEPLEEQLEVDGKSYSVGRGRGGKRELMLPAGAHDVRLTSRTSGYRIENVRRTEPVSQCVDPQCRTQVAYMVRTTRELVQDPYAIQVACQKDVEVTVRESQTTRLVFRVAPDRTCSVE